MRGLVIDTALGALSVAAFEGLTPAQLEQVVVPSGWSVARLLSHLTFDDEIFWGGAIVGGDHACIALITDGWRLPTPSGADAIARYRRWSSHTTELLHDVDLNSPPRWWPPREIFPFPSFPDARRCAQRPAQPGCRITGLAATTPARWPGVAG